MANERSDPASASTELFDWLNRGADLMGRSAEVVRQMQVDWDSMAVGDRAWTTDIIMNEVVNSWERFTPVLGEWIQHGVDGTGIALRSTWPDAPTHIRAAADRVGDPVPGVDGATYAEVTASAAERMVGRDYTSADAVEDWAVVVGKMVKDTWSAAARVRSAGLR